MKRHRLYNELAHLWPLLSPPEHYESEAGIIRSVIRERLGDGRLSVIEFGAGGGHTLMHLQGEFDCVAVDLAEPMLANCRALCPDVETIVGDMRDVALDRTFDVVLIHDAIDYLTTEEDLAKTFANASRHLKPGGLLLVAPTYTRENFVHGDLATDTAEPVGEDLSFVTYVHDADPQDSEFEMVLVYFITDENGQLLVETDHHVCGLFGEEEWLELVDAGGFTTELREDQDEEEPWRLFVGVKR